MNSNQLKFLEGKKPLDVANNLQANQQYFAFLNSSLDMGYTGDKSIIAWGVEDKNTDVICGDNFKILEENISSSVNENSKWFGYFGYGLKNELEKLPADENSYINTKNIFFFKPQNILVYSHKNNSWYIEKGEISEQYFEKSFKDTFPQTQNFKVKNLQSNFSKIDYLKKVGAINEYIKQGTIYQANLTRKFFGELENTEDGFKKIDSFEIYNKLTKASPAPYSAYIKYNELEIISSSPEQFLKVDASKNAETRPIKGTSSKSNNNQALANSEKDQSENLMITDLMRNDFSRVCNFGSVKVENLFEIAEFETLNHMQSTIKGKIAEDKTTLDLIKACFPPGSMTGAPKIKAMEICTELENQARGIYSGALGYISSSGEAEFSVIIRTIIIEGSKFEFQVGGGIVFDSAPEAELQETYTKASAIANVLGIFEDLKNL